MFHYDHSINVPAMQKPCQMIISSTPGRGHIVNKIAPPSMPRFLHVRFSHLFVFIFPHPAFSLTISPYSSLQLFWNTALSSSTRCIDQRAVHTRTSDLTDTDVAIVIFHQKSIR